MLGAGVGGWGVGGERGGIMGRYHIIFFLVNFSFSYGTCTLLFLCIRLLAVIHVLLS